MTEAKCSAHLSGFRPLRWVQVGLILSSLLFGLACAPKTWLVNHPNPVEDVKPFGFRKWVTETVEPDLVIIGIHGFCGASSDYKNLGEYMLSHQKRTAVYAYEVRGQGGDPLYERRGDIGNPEDWYRDLFAFTQLVGEQHPNAKIVWFGESMGAMIAAHAWREAPKDDPPCDGIILSSPIVRFRDDIPAWTPGLLQVAASTMPLVRVSLDAISGGQQVQMTQDSTHQTQTKKNPYHIEQHTLRLLATLAMHIRGMNDCAQEFTCPVLVLHGEHDFFNDDSDLRGFMARMPKEPKKTYYNYRGAYHLLMHDARRDKVFRDVARWTNQLR